MTGNRLSATQGRGARLARRCSPRRLRHAEGQRVTKSDRAAAWSRSKRRVPRRRLFCSTSARWVAVRRRSDGSHRTPSRGGVPSIAPHFPVEPVRKRRDQSRPRPSSPLTRPSPRLLELHLTELVGDGKSLGFRPRGSHASPVLRPRITETVAVDVAQVPCLAGDDGLVAAGAVVETSLDRWG